MTICNNPVDSGGNRKLSEIKLAHLPQLFLFYLSFWQSHRWLFPSTTLTCFKHIRHLVISPICALCYFLPSVAVVGSIVCSQLATSVVILSPLAKCDLTLLFVWNEVFLKSPHAPIGCRCQVTPHGHLLVGSRSFPKRLSGEARKCRPVKVEYVLEWRWFWPASGSRIENL